MIVPPDGCTGKLEGDEAQPVTNSTQKQRINPMAVELLLFIWLPPQRSSLFCASCASSRSDRWLSARDAARFGPEPDANLLFWNLRLLSS